MSRREKTQIIILIILIFLIILALVYFIFFTNRKKAEPVQKQEPQTQEPESSPETPQDNQTQPVENVEEEPEPTVYKFNPEEEEQRETTAEDLKRLGFAFAERFGSYSNQANFSNLVDLRLFMTINMRDWAEEYIKKQKQNEYSGEYYGITTKAITGQVEKFSPEEKEAEILITTRRRESREGEEDKIFNQQIIINFKQVSEEWKVDGAYWQ